jgi:perosamine synthetase
MIIPHSRPTISDEDVISVVSNLRSGLIAYGEEIERFEQEFSNYIGAREAVATSSGTNALHLALTALKIGPGDEVAMPSYVCASVLHAVRYTGASPRFSDIESTGYNIDYRSVKKRLTPKTKALIVPHMFGRAADLDNLVALGVPVIEDCAQAIGAKYKGRRLGSYGTISTFSFKATKLMTTGHGGMVLTNSKELLNRLRELSKYDEQEQYNIAYNYQLTDFQAALGRSQLKRLDLFIQRRHQIAKIYDEACQSMAIKASEDPDSIFFRYVIEIDELEQFIASMRQLGISCTKPVFKPLHRYLNGDDELPYTERAMKRAVSIPIYPSLKRDEIGHITRAIERERNNRKKV